MGKFRSYLAGLITAGTLYAGYQGATALKPGAERAYQESNKLVYGTIIKKIRDNNYKVKLDNEKIIGLEIIKSTRSDWEAEKELDLSLEEGTRIAFPKGNLDSPIFGIIPDPFSYDTELTDDARFVQKRAQRIKILENRMDENK